MTKTTALRNSTRLLVRLNQDIVMVVAIMAIGLSTASAIFGM